MCGDLAPVPTAVTWAGAGVGSALGQRTQVSGGSLQEIVQDRVPNQDPDSRSFSMADPDRVDPRERWWTRVSFPVT